MIGDFKKWGYPSTGGMIWKLGKMIPLYVLCEFPHLTIFLFCKIDPSGSLISSGDFSKKLTAKIGDFALRKKGREKTRMVKVAKSCHQVMWAQKNVTKRDSHSKCFISKSLNVNR